MGKAVWRRFISAYRQRRIKADEIRRAGIERQQLDSQRQDWKHQQLSQEELFTRLEISGAVKAAVAQLKPKLRMAILLKYFEELSYEEMAQVLGCSMGTVASRLNRGHKELARKLGHLRNALNAGECK